MINIRFIYSKNQPYESSSEGDKAALCSILPRQIDREARD